MDPKWSCVCGFSEDLWSNYYWRCPRCGKPLNIAFEKTFEPRGRGLSRYSSMLPFKPVKTMGEGSTPTLQYEDGVNKVLFKLEYLNPSGSFKDRGSALSISYAFSMGYRTVVEDTSGNTGISVSMYSALYGLKARIFMPKTAPRGKKILVRALGADVVETENREEAMYAVLKQIGSSFYVAHTWSFLYVLGASTISYEVYEECGTPDLVIAPIGSGGLFLGLNYGFKNLFDLGLAKETPRFIAVQGCSVQPVYERIYGYSRCGESLLADGVMVTKPPRLEEMVETITKGGHEIHLANDGEIMEALHELLQLGFIVEPTTAILWAAYRRIKERYRGKTVLIPLTGSGLKTIDELRAADRSPPHHR